MSIISQMVVSLPLHGLLHSASSSVLLHPRGVFVFFFTASGVLPFSCWNVFSAWFIDTKRIFSWHYGYFLIPYSFSLNNWFMCVCGASLVNNISGVLSPHQTIVSQLSCQLSLLARTSCGPGKWKTACHPGLCPGLHANIKAARPRFRKESDAHISEEDVFPSPQI